VERYQGWILGNLHKSTRDSLSVGYYGDCVVRVRLTHNDLIASGVVRGPQSPRIFPFANSTRSLTMLQYEFQAWSYLARSWRTLSHLSTGSRVHNKEFGEDGLCYCICMMGWRKMITPDMVGKMLSKISNLLYEARSGSYLFPRDQQGAESRRKLCLQLAFQNIIEEHNGKLPTIN